MLIGSGWAGIVAAVVGAAGGVAVLYLGIGKLVGGGVADAGDAIVVLALLVVCIPVGI